MTEKGGGEVSGSDEDRHPTDENGKYLKAGDDKFRVGRGGFMLVRDKDIAWHKKGDWVQTPYGQGSIEEVNCMACTYAVRLNGRTETIPFGDVKS